jgi:alpha-tubulin suppressor-like RCC1 family protein
MLSRSRSIRLAPTLLALAIGACSADSNEGREDTQTLPDTELPDVDLPETSPPEVVTFDTTPDLLAETADDVSLADGGTKIPSYCTEDPGGVFCPCDDNNDCNSGYCVPSRRGDQVCTRVCEEDCPDELECRLVRFPGSDPTFLCVDLQVNLCRPCRSNTECQGNFGSISNRCVHFGDLDGAFCGLGCETDTDCPSNYICDDVNEVESRTTVRQCVPEAGMCSCSERAVAESASTACNRLACFGSRTCGVDGLSECDARIPDTEICDAIDNNCNGATDEGFADTDGNGIANCVDPDIDGDGAGNDDDNCPEVANPDQNDGDGDGLGDACDPPDMPILSGSLPLSPANDNAPVIIGTAAAGTRVRLFTSAACNDDVAGEAVAAEDGTFVIGVAVADDSTTTYHATATDPFNGLSTTCSATRVTYIEDSTPPQRPELSSTNPRSPGNTTTFTVLGLAEAGSRLTLYADATCLTPLDANATPTLVPAGGSFTTNATVGANAELTLWAATVDAAGNVSACSAALRYRHDDIAPAAPVFNGTFPTSPSSTVTTVTLIGAAEGDTTIRLYNNDNCSGDPISTQTTGPNGIFTAVQTVAENSLTTFTATATDAAGNVSACSPEPVVYIHDNTDPAPPILLRTTPTSPGNVLLPVVSGTAEANGTVQLYSGPNCTGVSFGTARADADGTWSITATVNANAETFFYGHVTDLAGRRSACTETPLAYRHDGIAPAAPVVTGTTPGSPASNRSPSVNGTGEALATATLWTDATCTTAAGASGPIGADGRFAVPVDAAVNATTTWWATATDAAGNRSPCSATSTVYRHDDVAPAAPVLVMTRPGSPSSNPSPVVEGTTEGGARVDIYLNSNCSGMPAGSDTGDAQGAFEAQVAIATNMMNSIHATATDAAGNVSACTTVPLFYEHDDSEPIGPSFTGTTPASPNNTSTQPTLLGLSETGTTVRIHTDPDCLTAAVATGATQADGTFAIDVAVGANSNTVFYASATNAVGNVSPCSAPGIRYIHDASAPARPTWVGTTPPSPSNSSTTPSLRGRAEANATVRIHTNATCTNEVASTTAGTNTNFTVTVTANANATTGFYAQAIDAAGNISPCSMVLNYTHDNIAPGAPVLSATNPASPSNSTTPTVTGSAEASSIVRFYGNATCTGTLLGQGTASAAGAVSQAIAVGANQTTQIHATATDAADNVSACSTALAFENDSTPPAAPVWVGATPASPSNASTTPRLEGTAPAGVTVRLFVGNACTGSFAQTVTAAGNGTFAFDVTVTANTTTVFYAATADAVGNQSACTNPALSWTNDTNAPARPSITSSDPNSPSPNQSPSIRGTAEAASTLRLYTTSNCSGTILGTATVDGSGNWSIASVSVAANTTTGLYAAATDAAGNVSACSTPVFNYRHDNIKPNPPVMTGTNPFPLGNNATPSVLGTVDETGLRVRVYKTSDCSGQILREVSNAPLSWTASNVAADRNTTTTFRARAVDAANNISDCSSTSIAYLHDDLAPNAPTDLATIPPRWSRTVSTPTVTGRAEPNGNVTVWLSADCTGTSFTTTADASGNFSVVIDVGATNVDTAITANVRDSAGNLSSCSQSIQYRWDTVAPTFGGALAPTLPAGVDGETRATVTWNGATDNFTQTADMRYRVCRSMLCGATDCNWANPNAPNITWTAAGVTTRNDTDLLPNTRYYYAVRAVDEVGNEDLNTVVVSIKTRGRNGASDLWVGENASLAQLSAGGTHRWGAALPDPTSQVPIGFAPGSSHSCLLRSDGALRCTGANAYGQLGNGNTTNQTGWATVTGITNAIQVAVGLEHSCALLVSGEVRCWGNDSRGQLGNGSANSDSQTAAVIVYEDDAATVPLGGVTAIALGDFHGCALKANGEVWCWGSNGSGQLAPVAATSQSDHARRSVANNYVAITAGLEHTCGINAAGRVFCWGYNVQGQLGDGTNTNSSTPRDTGLTSAIAIRGSRRHTCAVLLDGTARCWGVNSAGELGNGATSTGQNTPVTVAGLTQVTHIGGGDKYSCARTADGQLYCWGLGDNGRLGTGNNTSSLSPALVAITTSVASVVEVQSDAETNCARLSDGKVGCWGDNRGGQTARGETTATGGVPLNVVSGLTQPTRKVATGGQHACAILASGALACWGDNESGQLGLGNTTRQLAPVTLTSNGTAVDVALGAKQTCSLRADRTVWCWGDNTGSRLGFASGATTAPREVTGIGSVRAIAVGAEHQCAVRLDGDVYCWGRNHRGQVDGTANAAIQTSPKKVEGVANAIGIAAGDAHSCALILGGAVRCWGDNSRRALGRTDAAATTVDAVAGITDAVELAVGSGQSCIRRLANGAMRCWGDNAANALGRTALTEGTLYASPQDVSVPSGVRFTQFARGSDLGCATAADGRAFCWGSNDRSEIGDGTTTNRAAPTAHLCLP